MAKDKPTTPRRPKPRASKHTTGSRPPCSKCREPWPHHQGWCPEIS